MGLFDTIKGLLCGEGIHVVLESTGLSEHVEGFLGEGSTLAETHAPTPYPSDERNRRIRSLRSSLSVGRVR